MADISWPSSPPNLAWMPAAFDETLEFDVEISTNRAGRVLTRALPGARWRVAMQFEALSVAYLTERRQVLAFLASLRGGADRLILHNLVTPAPRGTLQSGASTGGAVAVGATAVPIAAGGANAGRTLLRGDFIGLSGYQCLMLTSDLTLDGSGNGTAQVQPAVRQAVASGVAITLDRPQRRYVVTSPVVAMPHTGSALPGWGFEAVEA